MGKLTEVGNTPSGAALTTNGLFSGRCRRAAARNDIRIVQVAAALRCRKPRKPHKVSRSAGHRTKGRYKRQAEALQAKAGAPLPPCAKRRRASRSARSSRRSHARRERRDRDGRPTARRPTCPALKESEHKDQQSPAGTPARRAT